MAKPKMPVPDGELVSPGAKQTDPGGGGGWLEAECSEGLVT